MKRPQYVFRPNLSDPQHRRVWALLQQVPPAKRKEFLVQSMPQDFSAVLPKLWRKRQAWDTERTKRPPYRGEER